MNFSADMTESVFDFCINRMLASFKKMQIYTIIGNVKCAFDLVIVTITTKPYTPQKILNQ